MGMLECPGKRESLMVIENSKNRYLAKTQRRKDAKQEKKSVTADFLKFLRLCVFARFSFLNLSDEKIFAAHKEIERLQRRKWGDALTLWFVDRSFARLKQKHEVRYFYF